jgi:hypothetical protein
LLHANLVAGATGGGVFAVDENDRLVLYRRISLASLDASILGNAADALGCAAASHARVLDLPPLGLD